MRRAAGAAKFTFAGSSRVLATVTFLLIACARVGAQQLEDGDFSLWTFTSTGGAGGSAAREPSGGNPGARLRITTNAPAGTTNIVSAIKDDFVTTTPFQGVNFSLSLDFLSGPGAFGAGHAILILVQQGGSIYGTFLGTTGVQNSFTTIVFNGTFDQNSFSLISGPGSSTPDFTSGVPTNFGFGAANSDSGLTNYYDNFTLTSVAVPEPGTVTVLLLGAGLVLLCRKRS